VRWLVTGAGGMLGHDLLETLAADPSESVTAATRADLDVTDACAVRSAVAGQDVVLNAAAWTDVDGAESQEQQATRVNGDGPRTLAEACRDSGARLLHVSTDHDFSGEATVPYAEDGPTGRSFVTTMTRLERDRDTLDVVDDQRGQPTWSRDVADRLVALARLAVDVGAPAGVYHATSSGETTWCGLAKAVFSEVGADPGRVRPTTSARFPRPAPRPAYSVLGHDRWRLAGLPPLRPWREALHEALTRRGVDLGASRG